jgi:PAS domain S-box-containing protein
MIHPVHTLLLVENALLDRERYRRYLMSDASCTYRLLEAESAAAALALCGSEPIDAILLNSDLPDSNGLEFLEILHNHSPAARPPVVMITDSDETGSSVAIATMIQAIKLGAEDCLLKPLLTPESLQVAVKSAIENTRLRLQLQQSEDRFRISVENMLDCFGIYSAIRDESGQIVDLRIDYLNAAALENNRMSTADFGKGLCELLPSHRQTSLFEDYCRVVETGEPLLKEDLVYGDAFGTQNLTRACDIRANKLDDGLVISWRDVTIRKQAEIALNDANQQITTIWESMTDAYVTLDRDWRIVYANSAAIQVIRQLTGQEAEEVLGKTHWEVFPWTVGQPIEREYRRAMAEQVSVHFELFYEPSGDWFEIHAYPSQAGLGIYFRDHSDRIRHESNRRFNEQQLRDSEERLQLGIQVAGVALARFDYASNTVALSPEAAALYGIPSDELVVTRDRVHATFHPDEREKLEQIIAQVLDPAGDGWFAHDHRVVWSSGEVRWLSVQKQVFFDDSTDPARPDHAILAAIDITDRKQLQEALSQSKEQLRLIADTIPQIVWTTDAQGNTDYVNQRWLDYTGMTVDRASGQGWQNLLYPEDLPAVQAFWSEACETASVYEMEYRLRRADGMYRWHLTKGLPLRNDQGQVIKWFGTCTDIHNQKQAEVDRAQLLVETQSAREEAEAANRSKDEFVAVVAHELRSPLNAISGWAKLLKTRKFDEATLAKGLDTIWRNTQTQVQLIEDLLDVSRMVKGTLQINFAPVNLVNVLEAVLDNICLMAEAKGIQLQTHFTVTPQVSGDFNRLQQIVVNLLTNAIKFTGAGGQVEIGLEQIEAQVVLRVRDTGKGIAPEFLPYIFERFQQGQRNTGSKDGLGLGLAIVKNLVELHGGTITVESSGIDQGSTFTVRLPRLGVTAIDRSSPVDEMDQSALTGIRILAVDDEPDMLDLITYVLQDFGAEVTAATTATTALEYLVQFKPDILISDLSMPGGDGYELVQQVKSYPEGQIPAIALTAYASATYEERSRQAGFQEHLTKPVEPELLVATIVNLVSGRN